MKTLVIQLARFGDIYLTWPTLQKMVKNGHEVHLLVRETFAGATVGLPAGIRVHLLPSPALMSAVLEDFVTLESAQCEFANFLEPLYAQNFDQVINFTFSPFSSYLTHGFECQGSRVLGYTRHQDGFLNLPDDTSAYFYAQVGVDKPNRFHLIDLFAMMADVDLSPEDQRIPSLPKAQTDVEMHLKSLEDLGYVVVHVGASDQGKALSALQIKNIILEVLHRTSLSVVLIGSNREMAIAEQCKPKVGSWRIVDLVGKTKLPDLFLILSQAEALIGVDSAPIHMASLTNTPTLNLSCRYVCHFETGPRAEHSEVVRSDELSQIDPVEVGGVLLRVLSHKVQVQESKQDFCWETVQSLYLGQPYPTTVHRKTGLLLSRTIEVLPEVIRAYEHPHSAQAQKVITDFDEILNTYAKTDDFMGVFIRWFNAERIRIPPGTQAQIQGQTLNVLRNFQMVLTDWARQLSEDVKFLDERLDWNEQLDAVVKHFRFYNLEKGVEVLQDFLSENGFRLSAGGNSDAALDVQRRIENALRLSDYAQVADLLEYDLRTLMYGKDMIA